MEIDLSKQLDPTIPIMYGDGTKVYDELASHYLTHDTGYFILAPSGSGKTHYIKAQTDRHWMDGDDLWIKTNAHPAGEWWLESLERTIVIDERCDIMTIQAKELGFWILGASNTFLKPDAIVIPEWETHKKWIVKRENGDYDGGLTSKNFDQLQRHREWILKWTEQGVPKFKTVEEATQFLSSKSIS
jgi:hypothetical protein